MDTIELDPRLRHSTSFLGRTSRMLINGELVGAVSGKTFEVVNPATGAVIANVPEGDKADVDLAVATARRAFDDGVWARVSPSEKSRILWRIADLIERDHEELAELESIDNGKPYAVARVADLPLAVDMFRYMGGWATKIGGRTIPWLLPGQFLSYTVKEPVGVVGQIIPWNFPLLIANNGAQPGSLTLAGPGTLTLSGTSTYTGTTTVNGSSHLDTTTGGGAAGLDRLISPDAVVGLAVGGGEADWDLGNGLGNGDGQLFQMGVYGATRWGDSYMTGGFAYGHADVGTNRNVALGGLNDHLTASYGADLLSGRVETGRRFAMSPVTGLTPYAAFEVESIDTPAYAERDASGLAGAALSYVSQTTTDPRTELGAWFDHEMSAGGRGSCAGGSPGPTISFRTARRSPRFRNCRSPGLRWQARRKRATPRSSAPASRRGSRKTCSSGSSSTARSQARHKPMAALRRCASPGR